MSIKRVNRLIKLVMKRQGCTESEAVDFICNAAQEKVMALPSKHQTGSPV